MWGPVRVGGLFERVDTGRASAPVSERSGIRFPERHADCSGARPSWFPFQMNVCDEDAPDPVPLSRRHRTTDPQ